MKIETIEIIETVYVKNNIDVEYYRLGPNEWYVQIGASLERIRCESLERQYQEYVKNNAI
jgi:hypothetical protein